MLFYTFYYNVFLMGGITILFHHVLKKYDVEVQLFEKFGINMMRSLICGTIAHEAYNKSKYLWLDKCHENQIILHKFQDFHYMFLSYFVFDTVLLYLFLPFSLLCRLNKMPFALPFLPLYAPYKKRK